MPNIMKKLLQTDTPTVNINIFNVVCLPVMVKNLRITTIKPITYDRSFCKKVFSSLDICFINIYNLFREH